MTTDKLENSQALTTPEPKKVRGTSPSPSPVAAKQAHMPMSSEKRSSLTSM
eukprot:CAMPEP_0116886880 /NCGR_PEP_ID=MMETSP0463-20121206/20870_1 /TAXON_ID=181622 /ORGANISM="Strombidinopsis sp, Strain SopsisLIS2011" /LENGTH=50 /DNA_ID=CAMNT_0004548023 /DNA_START=447 /DNA_END=599 /DNA_ORIENTATION=+